MPVGGPFSGGYSTFSRRWLTRRNLNPDNLAVVRVAGDSMEPKLSNGDLAVIDTTATEMKDGVTYVFRLGDDLLIKRLQILPQRQVNLCSHNPEYSPIQVELASGELTSVGRVVASMHEW
ncbi:helix-turn-helix transcriptional regulator [Phaeobacter inhibens]|uniref:S24 family peptidase n=1 Tax=Phaeobacter inhibens TaxID=221822 RepID=UPI0022B22777|nr:S24 family peptidase [Phaeobacter inhibens]